MRFNLPPSLIEALRAHRSSRGWRWSAVEDEQEAVLLDPGLGPALFLTFDGRVLIDGEAWDGQPIREASDDEAISAIVAGAKKTGVIELLSLIPPKPVGGRDCPRCAGTRRWTIQSPEGHAFLDVEGKQFDIVCPDCSGRGWLP